MLIGHFGINLCRRGDPRKSPDEIYSQKFSTEKERKSDAQIKNISTKIKKLKEQRARLISPV